MNLWDLAFERSIADDPLRFLGDALELLMAYASAKRVGIFLGKNDAEFFVGHEVDQVALDWARDVWRRQRSLLRAGDHILDKTHCAVPLERKDPMFPMAFIYLGADLPLSGDHVRSGIAALRGSLEHALQLALGKAPAAIPRAIDEFLQSNPREAVLRRQLEGLLHSHEWNVARVARILGVTRQTVYTRMDRLRIARLRIPKGRA
jgi:Bacterial regulatory protein, Fis family